MKKLITLVLCAGILFAVCGTAATAATNNKPSSWAENEVNTAIKANLVPAILQTDYIKSITRAEYCALAVKLYESIMGEIRGRIYFTDTNDVNVEKMAFVGIVHGVGNNKFDPDSQLTREQAATLMARIAEALGFPFQQHPVTFKDKADISSWALESIGQALGAGIMFGTGDNVFSPKGSYTREQSIITMVRLNSYITDQTCTIQLCDPDPVPVQIYEDQTVSTPSYEFPIYVPPQEIYIEQQPVRSLIRLDVTQPEMTEYYIGTTVISTYGFTATAVYNDGSIKNVTPSCGFGFFATVNRDFDSSTPGIKAIEVTYSENGITVSSHFYITIINRVLQSIRVVVDPVVVDGWTIPSTAVWAVYDNSSGWACPYKWDWIWESNQTFTVTYTEGGITKTARHTLASVYLPWVEQVMKPLG